MNPNFYQNAGGTSQIRSVWSKDPMIANSSCTLQEKTPARVLAFAIAISSGTVVAVTVADLPVFLFHGIVGTICDSVTIAANLTAE